MEVIVQGDGSGTLQEDSGPVNVYLHSETPCIYLTGEATYAVFPAFSGLPHQGLHHIVDMPGELIISDWLAVVLQLLVKERVCKAGCCTSISGFMVVASSGAHQYGSRAFEALFLSSCRLAYRHLGGP